VPAYYTLNHSVTFIWLVVTTTHPSFLKHVRVTATAVRLNRRTCASRNSPSTLSAQSLVGQATLKEACSHHVARNLLRPLDCTRSQCMLATTSYLKTLRNVQLKALNLTSTLLIMVTVV